MQNIFRRRALLLLAGIPAQAARKEPQERVPTERIPTDPVEMNSFAEQYNRYALRLRDGVIDVKQWDRVVKAWNGLVH